MKKHINTEYVRVRVGLLGLGDGLGLGYGRGLVRGEQVSDGEFRGKCSGGGAMSYIRQDGGCGRQSCTDDGSM